VVIHGAGMPAWERSLAGGSSVNGQPLGKLAKRGTTHKRSTPRERRGV
jgi:hypothetical protein